VAFGNRAHGCFRSRQEIPGRRPPRGQPGSQRRRGGRRRGRGPSQWSRRDGTRDSHRRRTGRGRHALGLRLRLHGRDAGRSGHCGVRGGEPGRVGAEDAHPEVRCGRGPGREEGERCHGCASQRPQGAAQSRGRGGRTGGVGDRDQRRDGECAGPAECAGAPRAFDSVEAAGELGHDDLKAERVEFTAADLAFLHSGAYNTPDGGHPKLDRTTRFFPSFLAR
jgi:hypothetical protein